MLLSAAAGIGSRRMGMVLPGFLASYLGDTMWALFFFALFRLALGRLRLWEVFLLTLSFSCLVELSQLWHPAWLEGIRGTLPGGLLLGYGFRWTDLVCYLTGCLLGWLAFRIVPGTSGP
jgi:hypothetical protein